MQGRSSTCVFHHEAKVVSVLVHGADFVAVGDPKCFAETDAGLSKKYNIKHETLGSDKKDLKEIKVFNKIIRVTDGGPELVADLRHAELVVRELGIKNCKLSKVPGSKATGERERWAPGHQAEQDYGDVLD